MRHPLLQLNSLFFLGSGLVRAGKELKVGGCDATRAGRRGVKRSSTWGSEEEELIVTGESKQAGQKEQEKVKHGSQCLEDWRAMALSGPTTAPAGCFQESVCGRRCPGVVAANLSHSRFHNSPPPQSHNRQKRQPKV